MKNSSKDKNSLPELVIRNVTSKDLVQVYQIEGLSFKHPYPPPFIDSFFRINPEFFLVAERAGNILGYTIALIRNNDLGHIFSIAVHPSERQKGIGRSLMKRLLEILRKKGLAIVRLEVRKSNTIARGFYEALSFEYSYTIQGYYGDEDALVYFKTLT